MYLNSGYVNDSRVDFKDTVRPLVVGSCGTYRLHSRASLPSYRPKGRQDYQLLYVAAGRAHFFFNGKEELVNAGSFVLYAPCEEQKYTYYGNEKPEVFWVHFTGYDVRNILNYHGFEKERHVYYTGTLPDFRWIYMRMIQEIQLNRPLQEDMLASLLNDLFLLIHRAMINNQASSRNVNTDIEEAILYFNEHYSEEISVSEYARAHHISTNHFIRNFKQIVGVSPMQYILSVRMSNAQSLLENDDCPIREVAAIVGYKDPLYFGQVFKHEIGMPPSAYRKLHNSTK